MLQEKNLPVSSLSPIWEKAGLDLLRAALKRMPAERFKVMTTLMKMNRMPRKAGITHKSFPRAKRDRNEK